MINSNEKSQTEVQIQGQYSPNFKPNRKITKIVGCWLKDQQKKYIQFISFYRKNLSSYNQRKQYIIPSCRKTKIFKKMSEFIGTRDKIQCRSHHDKQMKIFGRLRKIVQNYHQNSQRLDEGNKMLQEKKKLNTQKTNNNRSVAVAKQENIVSGQNQIINYMPFTYSPVVVPLYEMINFQQMQNQIYIFYCPAAQLYGHQN